MTARVDGLARAIRRPISKRQKLLDAAETLDHRIYEQKDIAKRAAPADADGAVNVVLVNGARIQATSDEIVAERPTR